MQRYPGSIRTHEVPGTGTAGFLPYRCFLGGDITQKGFGQHQNIGKFDFCKGPKHYSIPRSKVTPKPITLYSVSDENQQAPLKDPLHVPVGPITRARSKKIKEALNGLIQEIWADSKTGHSKLGPKEDEGVINLIQATDGADLA
jgi:hypothetical protein